MRKAYVVRFSTPDNCLLDGIWFGGEKAKTGYIFVHGLSSSVFAQHNTLQTDDSTMALYFNNRGHDELTGIKQLDNSLKGYTWKPGGQAHEIFTECIQDIQGAIDFLQKNGVENIFLVGHSTGCQKSVYYLSQSETDSIKGVVLLCPLSDYASAMKTDSTALEAATQYADRLVSDDKATELIPNKIWPYDLVDAQRFLSLYSPDSTEEIFNYFNENNTPVTLQKVTLPMLIVLADKDEYGDRPMSDIKKWFAKYSKSSDLSIHITDSSHNLSGKEEEVSRLIDKWRSKLSI